MPVKFYCGGRWKGIGDFREQISARNDGRIIGIFGSKSFKFYTSRILLRIPPGIDMENRCKENGGKRRGGWFLYKTHHGGSTKGVSCFNMDFDCSFSWHGRKASYLILSFDEAGMQSSLEDSLTHLIH